MSYWKPVIILIAALLFLIVAALMFNARPSVGDPSSMQPIAGQNSIARFVDLGSFLINLDSDEGSKYLKTTVALKLGKSGRKDNVEASIPEIRHHVNLEMQSMTVSELSTYEGKLKLAEKIREQAENIVGSPNKSSPQSSASPANKNSVIADVMFTSFIIQH
jgi:flagellar FliL protein